MFLGVIEIMYFVPDRLEAARWYAELLETELSWLDHPAHFFLKAGGQEIWFHQADAKMRAGTAGQVAYWHVAKFSQALERAEHMGAALFRGPLDRPDGRAMCQIKDPFGNVFGIVGPR